MSNWRLQPDGAYRRGIDTIDCIIHEPVTNVPEWTFTALQVGAYPLVTAVFVCSRDLYPTRETYLAAVFALADRLVVAVSAMYEERSE